MGSRRLAKFVVLSSAGDRLCGRSWELGHAEFSPKIVRFGAFAVDLTSAELRKHGSLLRLQEQPFKILQALLEQPGAIVSREELVRRLWPGGTFVDFERGLNAAVTRLRQALNDSAESPRYVETVARRGYRFIASIEPEAEALPAPVPPVRRPSWVMAGAASVLIVATLTGVWWVRSRPAPALADRALTVVPLTSEPGFAVCPTASPDGNQIAYEWDQGRREPRIFVKLVGPGEPVRLTRGNAEEFCPAWSPDGKYVAFVRAMTETKRGIFLVPALGGAERKVGEFNRGILYYPEFRPRLMSWTPDAGHLITAIPNEEGFSRLFVIATDTGERTLLATSDPNAHYWDRDPAVSPDGKLLVFSRERGYGASDLLVIGLSADLRAIGEARRLTSEADAGRYAETAAWTSDGHEVVYCSNREGSPRIWRIGLQPGAVPRQVRSVGPDSFLPVISKQGRLVYAHGYWDDNIWRQELTPHSGKLNAPENLISSTAQDSSAQYSPDGTHIAFQSARSGYYEVWICGSEGERCRQLTSYNGPMSGTPRWSPDGRSIAFDSAAAGKFDVYVVNVEGGSPRRLTPGPEEAEVPSWSRDGDWIYFSSRKTGRHEVWKVPSAGGTPVQVTRNGGFTAFESADGHYLYYTKDDLKTQLWRSALDGGSEIEIASNVIVRGFVPAAPDKIFYLQQEKPDRPATLNLLEIPTGKTNSIAVLSKTLELGLSVSPDLRYALYAQIDNQGSTLMLVDEFH